MAMLGTDILTELQNLIVPLMEDIQDRRALLELAVGNSKVYQRIDFSGPTDAFTIHVLTILAKYGEISPGRQALWAFLEVIRSRVGIDHQKHIDELRPDIEALSASYHDFGSGAIFARVYDRIGEIPEPTKPDKLFGHSDLLRHLNRLIDENKHVSLTGYGGTGKTALAATLADQRLAEGKGPILWVQARRGSADALYEAIAICFKQKEEIDRVQSGDEIKCMQTMLANAGVKLLVLDDVRNASIVMPMRQMAKGLPMLLTSRRAIGNVNASENLTALSPDDALELLIHHARNQKIGEADYRADADTRQLCQELGYHAFGIVIAGRWLAENKRKAKALLERIAQRRLTPPSIPMPEDFVHEGRETVKIVLDETFYALQPAAQEMLKVFGSLFEPQATTALLAICAGYGDQLAAEDALDELVLWNFASRDDNCYTMHDMVHAYAEVVRFGNAELDRRPIVISVQRYLKDYGQDFDTLGLDQPNILRAAEAADDEARTSIIRTLTIDGFFDAHGHTLAFLALLDKVLTYLWPKKAEGTLCPDQLKMLHHLLSKRGNAYFDRTEYQNAVETYQKALELAYNEERQATLLGLIAKSLRFCGDMCNSEQYFQRAYQKARSTSEPYLLSFVLEQQAHSAGDHGDYETARRVSAEQVSVNQQLMQADPSLHNRISLFYSLNNLATAEMRMGQKPLLEILQLAQRAEVLANEIQSDEIKAHAAWALTEIFHALGNRTQANHYLHQALSIFEEQGKILNMEQIQEFMEQNNYQRCA